MKTKLNFKERILLMQILPREHNILTLKIINTLNELLSASEEEHKEFQISQHNDTILWNKKGSEEKEFEIGEKALDIIQEALKKLDETKKAKIEHISLFEKFIEVPKNDCQN